MAPLGQEHGRRGHGRLTAESRASETAEDAEELIAHVDLPTRARSFRYVVPTSPVRPAHANLPLPVVDVLPLQAEQFSESQACRYGAEHERSERRVDRVQDGVDLLHSEWLHLLRLLLRRDRAWALERFGARERMVQQMPRLARIAQELV